MSGWEIGFYSLATLVMLFMAWVTYQNYRSHKASNDAYVKSLEPVPYKGGKK